MRFVPPRCFNCGMVLNNKVTTFHTMLDGGEDMTELHASLSDCCRMMLRTACVEPRLIRQLPNPQSFAAVTEVSKLEAEPQTLRANGSTEPM
jgi:DNA-directed RNA polymerase subunit N (RpoN/RPB10)